MRLLPPLTSRVTGKSGAGQTSSESQLPRFLLLLSLSPPHAQSLFALVRLYPLYTLRLAFNSVLPGLRPSSYALTHVIRFFDSIVVARLSGHRNYTRVHSALKEIKHCSPQNDGARSNLHSCQSGLIGRSYSHQIPHSSSLSLRFHLDPSNPTLRRV